MGLFGPSRTELIELFKKNDDGYVNRQFNFRVEDAKEDQQRKYSINMDAINQFTSLVKDLKMSEISRGLEMQTEESPQKDWAIAGGIASGLFGGMVGAAVALETMKENIEATRKHHEVGRKMVENGIQGIENINNDMEKVSEIAVKINSSQYFEYTDVMPDLINCFEVENVRVIADESVKVTKIKTFGGLEIYNLNKLLAYNSLGFFEAIISIKNNFYDVFPNETKKKIDGAFKVSIYDGDKEIAYGYITGDNWSVDNLSSAGFRKSFERKVTFKLLNKTTVVSSSINYTAKLSEPNLWLAQPRR